MALTLPGMPTTLAPATAPAPTADLSQLRASVSDILGFQGQAAADTQAATAADFQGQGATAQQTAYQTAGAIAGSNAALETVSGRIQQLQAARTVATTMGAQVAGTASSGLATSGSALAGLRSSYQQGRLTDQLISTQTGINVGGFLEQQAAAKGEADAAGIAATAAAALASSERTAAGTATTSAASETAALLGYLSATGQVGGTPNSPDLGSMTPGAAVALSPLSGTNGIPNLGTPNWTRNPDGTWTYGQGAGFGASGAMGGPQGAIQARIAAAVSGRTRMPIDQYLAMAENNPAAIPVGPLIPNF